MVSPKVELHVHLDGAIRQRTAYELIKKKNLRLPGDGSFETFVDSFLVKEPSTLFDFLRGFAIFLPGIVGDLEAIERISYEFCETQAEDGVIYAEARYCPHLLLPDVFYDAELLSSLPPGAQVPKMGKITPKCIVEAVNKGFARGEKDFGIVVRTILSCIRGKQEWSNDLLNLCIDFKDKGVVGIDVAGDEGGCVVIEGEESESRMLDPETTVVFQKAAELGIHRTVHAGEAGPALMVLKALNVLKAERIGHGYRVLEDAKIYERCLSDGVHFECCPQSSILTGAVSLNGNKTHPILRFALDKASFSISTDDPTVTNTKLSDEYELVKKWGLTTAQIQQANIEAMKNSFAEPAIKEAMLKRLYSAYGMNPSNP